MSGPTQDAARCGRHVPPDGLGPMLRAARTRTGLSLRALGRRAGLSAGYLCMLESGQRCPSVSTASALADALGLDREEWAVLFDAAVHGAGRDYPGRAAKRPAPAVRPLPIAAARDRGRAEPAEPDPAVPYAVAYEMARRLVRQATLSGVALVTRASDGVDIPAEALLEDTDPAVACQILAGFLALVLEVTLPDRGKGLLISVSRRVIED